MDDEARQNIRDDARSTRPRAGESVRDMRNWVGYALAGTGMVLLVLCLAAAGYGFEGWAWISGIGAVVLLAIGAAVAVAEHRRLRSGPADSVSG